MGRHIFKLPDVGEGVAEVEIVKWYAAVGEDVREEQPLVDIMTDKATVEIISPVSGRIVSRNGEEGGKLAVGSEFVVFETAGTEPAPQSIDKAVASVAAAPGQKANKISDKSLASPAVRERTKAMNLDLAKITGSGPEGRVLHGDIDKFLAQRQIKSSVTDNTIVAEGATKLTGLRKRIAERMEEAHRIPHFTYIEEVDATALEALRAKLNIQQKRPHLTLLPFIIRAMTKNLGDHPSINARFNAEQGYIQKFAEVHLGVATQTERGLLVPVIRNAERKDVWQLAEEIERVSSAARAGKANVEELSGSTITITSLGALGGIAATPIINPPEVAIIGVNKMIERPVVRGGVVAIAKMLNLSSSFDHRIVDGHEAAVFIKRLKDDLESPDSLIAL